jgi:hypothetical protein
MAEIEINGETREYRCTTRTLTIYEQEFCNDSLPRITGDLIADVMGKQKISTESLGFTLDDEGNIDAIIMDYTNENWNALRRALWAMLKTQSEIDRKHGRKTAEVPSWSRWDADLAEWEPDMREISIEVSQELQRGLFRAGAAASGKTSEEAQG